MAYQAEKITVPRQRRLIRKKRFLEKVPFSNSMLALRLNPKSPYYDSTLPRPIYFPGSRIPYWDEATVDEWIAASMPQQSEVHRAAEVPAAEKPISPRAPTVLNSRMADGSTRSMHIETRKPRRHVQISHSTAN